jgi:hypothetical protein
VATAKAEALYVVEDPIFFAHRTAIIHLASKARLATIHELGRWPEHGALMSYGPPIQLWERRQWPLQFLAWPRSDTFFSRSCRAPDPAA